MVATAEGGGCAFSERLRIAVWLGGEELEDGLKLHLGNSHAAFLWTACLYKVTSLWLIAIMGN